MGHCTHLSAHNLLASLSRLLARSSTHYQVCGKCHFWCPKMRLFWTEGWSFFEIMKISAWDQDHGDLKHPFYNLDKKRRTFFLLNFVLRIKNNKRSKDNLKKSTIQGPAELCSFNGLAAAHYQRDLLFSEITQFSMVLRNSFSRFLLFLWLPLYELSYSYQIRLLLKLF